LEWPDRADRDAERSVKPGLHSIPGGKHGLVWWDPRALELDKQEETGLRQQRILAADEAGAATESERASAAWEARRSSLLERGSMPSLRVRTVTELREEPAPVSGVTVREESTDAGRDARPGGKRFGILVHALLATVPFDASPVELEAASRAQARAIGASPEEVTAAAEAVRAALAHPVLQQARAAGTSCRREAPVLVREDDGSITEGVLDLAFRVADVGGPLWVVVDYKTDAELTARRAEYETQVRRYARMVAESAGERVTAVLLRV
jgi:ATP-dependent exoDNAse (exonuclease V) beta subunit